MKNKHDLNVRNLLEPELDDESIERGISEISRSHYETTLQHDLIKEELPDLLEYYTSKVKNWNKSIKKPEEEYSISEMTADNTFSIMKGQQKVLEITENTCIFTNPIDSKVLDAFSDQHKGAEIIVEMCGSATEARALQKAMEGKNTLKFSLEAIQQMKKTATSTEDKYLIAKLEIYIPAPIESETKKHLKPN